MSPLSTLSLVPPAARPAAAAPVADRRWRDERPADAGTACGRTGHGRPDRAALSDAVAAAAQRLAGSAPAGPAEGTSSADASAAAVADFSRALAIALRGDDTRHDRGHHRGHHRGHDLGRGHEMHRGHGHGHDHHGWRAFASHQGPAERVLALADRIAAPPTSATPPADEAPADPVAPVAAVPDAPDASAVPTDPAAPEADAPVNVLVPDVRTGRGVFEDFTTELLDRFAELQRALGAEPPEDEAGLREALSAFLREVAAELGLATPLEHRGSLLTEAA